MRYTITEHFELRGISKMKVTSTINLSSSSKGWTGVKKHMEHDPKLNHSNKDILKDLTQYNQSGKAFSDDVIDRRLENYFGTYVEEHDAKAIQNRHPERVYGSVGKYLDSKNKITAVATVGDMESRNELIRQLCPKGSYQSIKIPSSPESRTLVVTDPEVAKKFYGVYTQALSNFLKTNYKINGASCYSYFIPGRYSVHVDEAGAPHVHYELYATGKTKKGRPTTSLNQTLVNYAERVTGSHISGREALKWYRQFNDRNLARELDRQFKRVYGEQFKGLEFYRKGTKDVGRSMEQVKNIKRETQQAKYELVKSLTEIIPNKSYNGQKLSEPKAQMELANDASVRVLLNIAREAVSRLIKTAKRISEEARQKLENVFKREKELDVREDQIKQRENSQAKEQKLTKGLINSLLLANNLKEVHGKSVEDDLKLVFDQIAKTKGVKDAEKFFGGTLDNKYGIGSSVMSASVEYQKEHPVKKESKPITKHQKPRKPANFPGLGVPINQEFDFNNHGRQR